MRRTVAALAGASILMAGLVANASGSQPIILRDRGAGLAVDLNQVGVVLLSVDLENQLERLWYWYRIGNSGPEATIDTLPLVAFVATDTNPFVDPLEDTLTVRYGSASTFFVDVRLTLAGGVAGTGTADLAQLITVDNNSDSPLDFHFFQYSNFDIGQTSTGDREVLVNPNTVVVSEGSKKSETVETPAAAHYELAFFPTTLDKLDDGSPTTLADGPTTLGPGDVTWAFQWDKVIPPGDSFLISKDTSLARRRTSG